MLSSPLQRLQTHAQPRRVAIRHSMLLWVGPGFSDPDNEDEPTVEVKEVEEVEVSLEAMF